jgi:phosphatidylglycerophosphate synthase
LGLALVFWGLSRVLDGVDGIVARLGEPTAWGGVLDLVLDGMGYVAIPLAFGVQSGTVTGWMVVAVLLATFYLNVLSWSVLAAFHARREAGTHPGSRSGPGAPLPRGLIEGAETVVFFAAAMAFPAYALSILGVMAALVFVTVVERIVHAHRILSPP